MPKILRKHGCRFILSISFDAPELTFYDRDRVKAETIMDSARL